jgi:hypothetical protein
LEHNHRHFGAVRETTDQFPYSWIISFWSRFNITLFSTRWSNCAYCSRNYVNITYCLQTESSHITATCRGLQDPRAHLPAISFSGDNSRAEYLQHIQTLKARIQEEVEAIPYRMLASVMDNFVHGLRECMSQNGSYLPGVIFKK